MLFAAVGLHSKADREKEPVDLFYGDIRSVGQRIAIADPLSLRLLQSGNVQQLLVAAATSH